MAATSWSVCMFYQFFKCFSVMWNLPGTLWPSGGIRASVKTPEHMLAHWKKATQRARLFGCVCVCVVSLTLGCRCQDEEELYELTRHQIVLCFHLCPGVCVSVVSPDFWKNNAGYSLNCKPGENDGLGYVEGGGEAAGSGFTTWVLYFSLPLWSLCSLGQSKTEVSRVIYSCWRVIKLPSRGTSGFLGSVWDGWSRSLIHMKYPAEIWCWLH